MVASMSLVVIRKTEHAEHAALNIHTSVTNSKPIDKSKLMFRLNAAIKAVQQAADAVGRRWLLRHGDHVERQRSSREADTEHLGLRRSRRSLWVVELRPQFVELRARVVVADVVCRLGQMPQVAATSFEDVLQLSEDVGHLARAVGRLAREQSRNIDAGWTIRSDDSAEHRRGGHAGWRDEFDRLE